MHPSIETFIANTLDELDRDQSGTRGYELGVRLQYFLREQQPLLRPSRDQLAEILKEFHDFEMDSEWNTPETPGVNWLNTSRGLRRPDPFRHNLHWVLTGLEPDYHLMPILLQPD